MPHAHLDIDALARLHPLFSRMTGQVIWCLFEENDVPQPRLEAFLDHFLELKRSTLAWMESLLDEAAHPGPGMGDTVTHVRIVAPSCTNCDQNSDVDSTCPDCPGKALHGKLIDLRDPKAPCFFPPYSLGCRTCFEPVTAREFSTLDAPDLVDTACPAPIKALYCGDGWIFRHDWVRDNPDG